MNSDVAENDRNIVRFQQEAQATCAIRHPNIVDVLDFGVTKQGQSYLVMEYIEGRSLSDILEHEGAIDAERVINIFLQIADGLGKLHQHGIVHRDLKPSNIMLYERNGREAACLIDFGIAKKMDHTADQRLTTVGQVVDSPSYLSPEQAQDAPLDARSDIYSLGCTMYEALSGELPFDGASAAETMIKHILEEHVPVKERAPHMNISAVLDFAVTRALKKAPDERFQSMEDLIRTLEFARAAGALCA